MTGGEGGNVNSDKVMEVPASQAMELRLDVGGDKKDGWKTSKQTGEMVRFTFATAHSAHGPQCP